MEMEKVQDNDSEEIENALAKVDSTDDGNKVFIDTETNDQCKNENSSEKVNNHEVKITDDEKISDISDTKGSEVKDTHEVDDKQISDNKENKTDMLDKNDSDVLDREVSEINEGEEMAVTSEFIEFEFSPIKKEVSRRRDRSASPDEVAVLDKLYEASQKEDSDELSNLIFSDGDSQDGKESDTVNMEKNVGISEQGNAENKAIINLLKRKVPIEKEQIVDDIQSKIPKIEPENTVDFTNVINIRTTCIGSLPLGNLTIVPFENQKPEKKRKRNPYRTPTPPNLNPSGDPILEKVIDVTRFKRIHDSRPRQRIDPRQRSEQQSSQNQSSERNLIDYSILTKALTKTLESKLQEGENNDVKIVIFCNNKPIQSFSVRSNGNKAESKAVKTNLPPSVLPTASSILSAQKLAKGPDTSVYLSEVLSQNRTCLTKQLNYNTGAPKKAAIPRIQEVKAILERNRRIAMKSLEKFETKRAKTRRITDEQINRLRKEFLPPKEFNAGNEIKTNLESEQQIVNSNDDEDMAENNLVINDSITTDENCNENLTMVKCDQCHKVFKQQRYLNRHKIRVHSSSKQVNEVKEQSASPQNKEPVQGDRIDKALAVLLAKSNETTLKDMKEIADKTNDDSVPETKKMDGTSEEVETTATVIKTEPVSESEDQEIQTLLADGNVMNLLETADKNKRSLFDLENQSQGVLAKDLLSPSYKSKAFALDSRPPITDEGLTEPVYVCEQCGKFYRARKTLKDHFLREHAKDKDDEPLYLYITGNKYQCPICFNNYHSGSELVSHTKKHTGELRSVCKLCGKVYSSVHVLRRHIDNIHSDVKPRPFQCELCDYAASNKWHLKEHYRRHTGEQPYKCPVCVKSFSHQGTMNRHCKTIHKLEIPSQRPFIRNNISELPDLPYAAAMPGEEEFPMPEGFPTNEDINLMCGAENDTSFNSADSGKETDLDLSIVKTEPMDVEVDA